MGRVNGAFGVRGEVKLWSWTEPRDAGLALLLLRWRGRWFCPTRDRGWLLRKRCALSLSLSLLGLCDPRSHTWIAKGNSLVKERKESRDGDEHADDHGNDLATHVMLRLAVQL